jgi:hypothetical protein
MLLPDPAKFPQGLEPIVQHVHSLGMQWGMYLPFHACPATGPTRFDHATADIRLCAKLNASLVKVDALRCVPLPPPLTAAPDRRAWLLFTWMTFTLLCSGKCGLLEKRVGTSCSFSTSPNDTETQMHAFSRAIQNSSVPHMFLSNCHMGCMTTSDERRGGFQPWCSATSDMWRTSSDLEPNWESVMFNLGTMVGRGKDAGPYIGWNNPDILEVGVIRKGMSPLTVVEAQTHFALVRYRIALRHAM